MASSDATNIQSSIVQDGDSYVLNGTKWWISGCPIIRNCFFFFLLIRTNCVYIYMLLYIGAVDPRCKICIFMGKTDAQAPRHQQQVSVQNRKQLACGN